MNKKIILLIIAIIIIAAGIFAVFTSQNQPVKNNATNNTTNSVNITNWTLSNETKENAVSQSSSNEKTEKDPKYNSEDYVERWDSSQKDGDTWAYTHSQPTKTEDGHTYKRMYNPDTGENYWGYMY